MIDSWNSDWPLHILYFAQWRRQNSNIVFFNYFNSDIFMDADIIFSNQFKLREFFMEICLWKDIKRLRKQLKSVSKKKSVENICTKFNNLNFYFIYCDSKLDRSDFIYWKHTRTEILHPDHHVLNWLDFGSSYLHFSLESH